jgi:hypothetical protein
MEPPEPLDAPEPPEPPDVLARLGEDLLLLSVRPRDGRIVTISRINFGLMGSELVRLAALRRVDVDKKQIIVLNTMTTGDPELDTALQGIHESRRPPRPKFWVAHPRRGIRDAYIARLVAAGALRREKSGFLGGSRLIVGAPLRADDARARLDAIAESTGHVDVIDAAFGGLARAVGLDRFLYPRFADRHLRRRLAEIAAGKWTRPAPTAQATGAATTAAVQAADASARAATDAATAAAMAAATQAATDAAIQAAVQASTDAAIAAATAASDAGGAAHGHH